MEVNKIEDFIQDRQVNLKNKSAVPWKFFAIGKEKMTGKNFLKTDMTREFDRFVQSYQNFQNLNRSNIHNEFNNNN